jgi:hypothetical protein
MNESLQRVDSCSQAWIGYKVHMPFPSWPGWGQEPVVCTGTEAFTATTYRPQDRNCNSFRFNSPASHRKAQEQLPDKLELAMDHWLVASFRELEEGSGPRIIHEAHSHYSLHIAAATHRSHIYCHCHFLPWDRISGRYTLWFAFGGPLYLMYYETAGVLVLVLFLGRHRGFAMNWSIECPC